MPSKLEKNHIRLDRDTQNRRVKIPLSEHEPIRRRYKKGESMRELARAYGVNKRLIQFIVYPERYAHSKVLQKERRKDRRYYDREKHRVAIGETRRYRQRVLKQATQQAT